MVWGTWNDPLHCLNDNSGLFQPGISHGCVHCGSMGYLTFAIVSSVIEIRRNIGQAAEPPTAFQINMILTWIISEACLWVRLKVNTETSRLERPLSFRRVQLSFCFCLHSVFPLPFVLEQVAHQSEMTRDRPPNSPWDNLSLHLVCWVSLEHSETAVKVSLIHGNKLAYADEYAGWFG